MKEPGIRLMVRNVFGGGDQAWATVELVAVAECKSGMFVAFAASCIVTLGTPDTVFSGLKFDNTYAWCMRFDESGTIVEVRAYLDSWMVKQAIEENEVPSNRAPVLSLK
jgi:ketosteroid isomerase-like protein